MCCQVPGRSTNFRSTISTPRSVGELDRFAGRGRARHCAHLRAVQLRHLLRLPSEVLALAYLMNRISEYFGSGQRSSATTFSSRSAAAARAPPSPGPPRRACSCACASTSSCGWFSARFADSSATIASTNSLDQLRRSRRRARSAPASRSIAEVPRRRRQQHRAGDRRRRLGLDVELRRRTARGTPRSATRARARRAPRSCANSVDRSASSTSYGSASGVARRFSSPRRSASACHSSE